MKMKVKAKMDDLDHEPGWEVMEKINAAATATGARFGDSVVELIITVKAKNITEEVGVDDDGCRNFEGLEIEILEE